MSAFGRYRRLFDVPGLGASFLASLPGRLPIGIMGLALILHVQKLSASFALAGAVSAAYIAGLGLSAPLVGRLLDRVGPAPVLAATALIYPLAVLSLLGLLGAGAGTLPLLACALLAGGSLPPVTIAMRALLPRLLGDPTLLPSAYSLDVAILESMLILGPALVAGFVAAGDAGGAVAAAALLGGAGSWLFRRSPAVRGWQPHGEEDRPGILAVLRSPGLGALMLSCFGYAAAFGLFEVAITGFATEAGRRHLAGLILALASVGSAAGALFYGGRDWRPSLPAQFVIALALMTAGLLALSPVTGLLPYAIGCLLAALPMAVVLLVQQLIIQRLAPEGALAETITWVGTFLLAGVSSGFALGGALLEWGPSRHVLHAAAAATLLSGGLAGVMLWPLRGRLPGDRQVEEDRAA